MRLDILKGADGNVNKYKAYRHAWRDINKAIQTGHFAEAVIREESIIRDRLISYLCKVNELDQNRPDDGNTPLKILIKRWKKSVPQPIQDLRFEDLQTATDEWREKRNKVAHEIVASLPGQEHPDIVEFKELEKQVAIDGEQLAKSIQNWYRRVKDQMKKDTTSAIPM